MIESVRIRGFRAHADTGLELGRFTVLVGDNASGKTSVLDALRVLGLLADTARVPAFPDHLLPSELFARNGDGALTFEAAGTDRSERWEFQAKIVERENPIFTLGGSARWNLQLVGRRGGVEFHRDPPLSPNGHVYLEREEEQPIPATLGWVEAFNLRFDQIAASAHSDEADVRVAFDGSNTAVVLAAMKLSDDPAFERIVEATRRLFPSVERISVGRAELKHRPGSIGNKIIFDFRGAPRVPAHAASHGTLIVVALMTILFSRRRPSLVLLDDLDHALHPRAQMELMKLLQELLALPEFADVQIVATTHSPYVLDMVEPRHVYAFAMRDDGVAASRRLSEHPDAARSHGVLSAGQLWALDSEREWVLRNAS